MNEIYRKNGRRYERILYSDWTGFPSDGVFLVTKPYSKGCKNVSGYSCILKIGELPDVYPFAQMAVSAVDLANFMVKNCENYAKENNGRLPSPYEESMSILKFLASLK